MFTKFFMRIWKGCEVLRSCKSSRFVVTPAKRKIVVEMTEKSINGGSLNVRSFNNEIKECEVGDLRYERNLDVLGLCEFFRNKLVYKSGVEERVRSREAVAITVDRLHFGESGGESLVTVDKDEIKEKEVDLCECIWVKE